MDPAAGHQGELRVSPVHGQTEGSSFVFLTWTFFTRWDWSGVSPALVLGGV